MRVVEGTGHGPLEGLGSARASIASTSQHRLEHGPVAGVAHEAQASTGFQRTSQASLLFAHVAQFGDQIWLLAQTAFFVVPSPKRRTG